MDDYDVFPLAVSDDGPERVLVVTRRDELGMPAEVELLPAETAELWDADRWSARPPV